MIINKKGVSNSKNNRCGVFPHRLIFYQSAVWARQVPCGLMIVMVALRVGRTSTRQAPRQAEQRIRRGRLSPKWTLFSGIVPTPLHNGHSRIFSPY